MRSVGLTKNLSSPLGTSEEPLERKGKAMSVKPSNCQNVIRDKVVMSDILTPSGATGDQPKPLFVDPECVYDVVSVDFVVTTPYVAGQPAQVRVGIIGNPIKFVNNQSLGAAAVGAGGVVGPLPQTNTVRLEKGQALTVGHNQAAAQTGEGILVIKLRPHDQQYVGSKRPQAAQATV